MMKGKKYDWKDSNLAMFGSDTEKQVKKESAESELAWQGAGQEVGVQIWRIEKFKVADWPKKDYGNFFSGDSYIILNTYKKKGEDDLEYDVHFWIGKESSQDEYGTAAYKTVELDTLLNDKAVQYREVQGGESDIFCSYFNITTMEGGMDSGFNHVESEEYRPRLLHVKGKGRNIVVSEVPLKRANLNTGDVYILDLGKKMYQAPGCDCNILEKAKATQHVANMRANRGSCQLEVLDSFSCSEDDPFYSKVVEYEVEGDEDETESVNNFSPITALLKVSDADGKMEMTKVKDADITKEDFESNDVFIFDTGPQCYVWIGSSASEAEKRNGMSYAHTYLGQTDHPCAAVSIMKQGRETSRFHSHF